MLSLLIFLPIITSILLFLLPISIKTLKAISTSVMLVVLVIALYLYFNFESIESMQFVQHVNWIPSYGISYHVGVDGISISLLVMIAIIMPSIAIALHNRDSKGFWLNLLLAQGGITGALLAQDLILFYLFWETMLLPIFFMIGLFGYGRNRFISMKFTIYTIFGSLIMLIGILYIANAYHEMTGFYSFSLKELSHVKLSTSESLLTFMAFMLAFGIKIPLFPFHTWLSDTYRSAPTGAVVIMSALMAKLGVYAIWRLLFTLFNQSVHEISYYFICLGLFGMLYFAIIAIHQSHLKRQFAYSSASHLSLIVVGIFIFNPYTLLGASYFIASHALSSAAIFIMIGMLYERTNTHSIEALGGIASQAPKFAFLFTFFALSIVGIPFSAGFVSELLIILGAFEYNIFIGFISATTLILAILFVFKTLAKSIYSSRENPYNFYDLKTNESIILIPLALLIIIMGIFPNYFLQKIEPSVKHSIKLSQIKDKNVN